ncbi:unnamed protein product [Rotaria sp. Silwood2]|nr:unnamed protein product [Rotaria sp. Silwood2]CAF4792986.1 unnamed protein product [Rotaria sp. Silwood2]
MSTFYFQWSYVDKLFNKTLYPIFTKKDQSKENFAKLVFFFQKLLVHHILIDKDYVDKIEKQLSNSDSQVSSTPPVIQLSQPSSSRVITISEP